MKCSCAMTFYNVYKLALFKFIKGKGFFTFIRSRLPKHTVTQLNRLIGLRCKIAKVNTNVTFMRTCIETDIYPTTFFKQLRRNKLKPSTVNLKRLAESHIDSLNEELSNLRIAHSLLYPVVESLNLYCRIKFYNYCSSVTRKVQDKQCIKNERLLSKESATSNFATNLDKYVLNFSDVVLTKTQKEALSVGLKFSIPPRGNNPIYVRTQFENLSEQLKDLVPSSADAASWFKSRLVDLAHQYERTPIRQSCLLNKQHIQQLKLLQKNEKLVILPPDKGSGTVILNREDYNQKIAQILSDTDKFIVDEDQKDNVLKIEQRIVNYLKDLLTRGLIDKTLFTQLCPKGSITPRMYGLPKTHKDGIPLRPILSMVGSPFHKLAQWLVEILQPVRAKFCRFSLKDSFEFVDCIKDLDVKDKIMCSFDVSSLFTNVPTQEVIDIICKFVKDNGLTLKLPLKELSDLLHLCTRNVQFLFNGVFYKQIDGVAMGSPLGPILADIFMAHLETIASTEIQRQSMYRRYVDDIFAV